MALESNTLFLFKLPIVKGGQYAFSLDQSTSVRNTVQGIVVEETAAKKTKHLSQLTKADFKKDNYQVHAIFRIFSTFTLQ